MRALLPLAALAALVVVLVAGLVLFLRLPGPPAPASAHVAPTGTQATLDGEERTDSLTAPPDRRATAGVESEPAAPASADPAPASDAPFALALDGRAVDVDGAPLAGVAVRIVGVDGVLHTTDADGRLDARLELGGSTGARLARPSVPRGLVVRLERDAFLPGEVRTRVWADGAAHLGEVVLRRGVRITGTVVDQEGTPVPAQVLALDATAAPELFAPSPPTGGALAATLQSARPLARASESSNGRGEFTLDVPLDGPEAERPPTVFVAAYAFQFVRQEHVGTVARPALELALGTPPPEVRLELPTTRADNEVPAPELELHGRVVYVTGAPAPKARVTAVQSDLRHPAGGRFSTNSSTSADADGRFRFRVHPPGDSPIELYAALDIARAEARCTDASTEVVLRLAEPSLAEVRCVDGAGRPVADAAVTCDPAETEDGGGVALGPIPRALVAQRPVPSGADGRARVPLADGDVLTVCVEAAGYRIWRRTLSRAELEAGTTATLEPGEALAGRVLRRGAPVGDAAVELIALDGEGWRPAASPRADTLLDGRPFTVRPWRRRGGASGPVRSDGRGRFAHRVESAGAYALRVEPADGPAQVFGPFEVELPDGRLDLELELDAPGVLRGRVLVGADDDPARIVVAAHDGWGQAYITAPDATGAYRFDALAPGPYQLRLLEPPSPSVVHVVPARGAGPGRTPVQLDRFAHQVVVPAGGSATRDLELPRDTGATLHGRLAFDAGDEPAPDLREVRAWLRATDAPRVGEQVPLDAGGRFTLEAAPGAYRLELRVGPHERDGLRFGPAQLALDVELLPGEAEREWRVGVAWLDVLSPPDQLRFLSFDVQAPNGLVARGEPRHLAHGDGVESTAQWVPAGEIALEVADGHDQPARSTGTFVLGPGERRTLDLR